MDKVEVVKNAIDSVFSDTKVPQSETASRLEEIIEHCRGLISTLDVDD